jgi:2-dehydro-3-deoxygalactonokinase
VVDRREGAGVGALNGALEGALREAVAPWRQDGEPREIRLCGMVGSRNGWVEAPYVQCPTDLAGWRAGAVELSLDGAPVRILPGVAGATPAGAPDVMRGEEAQVFGAMSLAPKARRRHFVLPGTHSKWVEAADGKIRGLQTYFTGEMFALLRDVSTLLKVERGASRPAHEPEAFREGLEEALAGRLLGAVFQARSQQLVRGRSSGWAQSFLSGLLIGAECREALQAFDAEALAIVGDPALASLYVEALEGYGRSSTILDGDDCVLAGLTQMECSHAG